MPVLKTSDIAPGELVGVTQDGQEILIAADLKGSIYATANICPHLGTPLDQGTINAAGALVCPLHKSAFSLEDGKLVGDWCPFPPVLGPLVLGRLEPAKDLAVFPVRASGGNIQVWCVCVVWMGRVVSFGVGIVARKCVMHGRRSLRLVLVCLFLVLILCCIYTVHTRFAGVEKYHVTAECSSGMLMLSAPTQAFLFGVGPSKNLYFSFMIALLVEAACCFTSGAVLVFRRWRGIGGG